MREQERRPNDELRRRADEVLSAALELPPEERSAFVAAAGDAELEALVGRLLRHAEASGGELIPGLPAAEEVSPPGTVVGRYRLLDVVGRGGMALVYRAERVDGGFEQHVALKQLRGPVSESLVRRLEQERQILARATHPDIARLLDGGVDDGGRPFLVMELVDGVPVDEHCDRERLTVRRRLELFLRIARAVQYAHRNLVVHRDIKPSNILVTADGHPKLLDFGIARLLAEPPAEGPLTLHGLRPMTPAYASPEQLRNEPVTTLSDVYQLGLLLYLLLTGRTPYRQAGSRSPLELARAVTEEPPTHPSKALLEAKAGNGGPGAEEIARRRRTAPARLARQLGGDLGAIILMALRKEPDRRYASVALMVDDVERHLAGRTVAARPDSLWYRARTFSRRYPFAVLFAVLLFVSLAAFSAVTAVQSRRIAAERDRANREAAVAGEVSGFLTGLFEVADPGESRGNTVTAREILDRGSAEIDLRMAEPSLARARLKRTMGTVYANLGLYEEALPLHEEALATAAEIGGEKSLETLTAQADLAGLLLKMGRYDEAEPLILSALTSLRELVGEEHPSALDAARHLAALRVFQGRAEEADAGFRRLLEIRRRVQGPDHPETLDAANSLATTLFMRGRLDEAEGLYREVLAGLERAVGPDHPRTLKAASNLGSVWVQLERFEEAEPLLRSTIERRRRVLGDDHPETLTAWSNLAGLLADRGDRGEAEELYRQVYEGRSAALGSEHASTVNALYDLAWVVSFDGARRRQAVDLYRQVLAGYEKALGPEHPFAVDVVYQLAVLAAGGGRHEEALALLREAVERGYRKRDLLEEPAFAPLAGSPELRSLRETVRERLGRD